VRWVRLLRRVPSCVKKKKKKDPRIDLSSFQGGCGDPAQQQQPHFPTWAGPYLDLGGPNSKRIQFLVNIGE